MKYFFPIHLDGGNRGCEGIAKGTAVLLGAEVKKQIALCRKVKLDTFLGVDKYVTLQQDKTYSLYERLINKLKGIIGWKRKKSIDYCFDFLDQMECEDIMVSTGGDMMCYDNNQVIDTVHFTKSKGRKAILWGCSMGEKNLTPEKFGALKEFDLIYARESLSYDFFKKIGLENVVCFPDPAFVLDSEETILPKCFSSSDVIGLNISNYVTDGFTLDSPKGREVVKLIDYIIENTKCHILLVPHVLWCEQDDRIICKLITETFKEHNNRLSTLDSVMLNYLQIRYIISKCKIFIGARTHAVISAYSTCVPTIALGYSIKARGIAKDLGLPAELVVDCSELNENGMVDSLKYLLIHIDVVKEILSSIMPIYRVKPFEIKRYL